MRGEKEEGGGGKEGGGGGGGWKERGREVKRERGRGREGRHN